MNADAHPRLFGHRRNLTREGGEIVPQLLLFIVAVQFRHRAKTRAACPLLQLINIKSPRLSPTPRRFRRRAPHAIGHMRIGRIGDIRRAEIADMPFVLLHLLVALGQIQRNRRHIVHTGIAHTV